LEIASVGVVGETVVGRSVVIGVQVPGSYLAVILVLGVGDFSISLCMILRVSINGQLNSKFGRIG